MRVADHTAGVWRHTGPLSQHRAIRIVDRDQAVGATAGLPFQPEQCAVDERVAVAITLGLV